jgi:uncharacterized protein
MAPAQYTTSIPVDVSAVDRENLAKNIFLIPDGNQYILYAPLNHFVASVNGTTARLIQQFLIDRDPESVPPPIRSQLADLTWAQVPEKLPAVRDPGRPFEPTQVTIFPTNQCMLRCEYCYASAGGAAPRRVDLRAIGPAIELVIAATKRRGQTATVAFHGGCDPLFSPEIVKSSVGYACAAGERESVKVRLVISTSGAVSEKTAEWLARTFHSVCLSCDGPPDIQDRQRPLADGSPSSPLVSRTAGVLRDHNVPCGIRATVTARTVHRMTEMVDYFIEVFGMRQMHFEPVHPCGRCATESIAAPSSLEFVEHFSAAWEHARSRNAFLRYSGCRLGWLTERFCAVDGDNFCLTPEGHMSSCYEVPDTSHPLADTLIFGRFDPTPQSFVVDQDKLAVLRRLNVTYKEFCKSCFAKWNCGGDCPVKGITGHTNLLSDYSYKPGARCDINRELTLRSLRRALEFQGDDKHACSTPQRHN